ncbi:MAG TPA: endopeptidase La [Syntrophobacteria bacterium]|nr:endopeptidase La [Syntrophobacteria bacterium]
MNHEEIRDNEHLQIDVTNLPPELPLLPIRDVVVFTSMILPLFVGRDRSIQAVEEALAASRLIFLATQKEQQEEDPSPEHIYRVGTVATVLRMLKLPDGRVKVLVQGLSRGTIADFVQLTPYFRVRITPLAEGPAPPTSVEMEALLRNVREQSEQILSLRGILSSDVVTLLNSVEDPGRLADLVASNLRLRVEAAQEILEITDPMQRLLKVNECLAKELELSTVQARIQSEAKEEMNRTQREYYLREQLRAIKRELGDLDERDEELEDLRKKITKARMSKVAREEALKQLNRLEQMHPDAAEASMVRTYLDWLVELPWNRGTRDHLDLKRAKEVLDEDHYDLDQVKERILEYLGVRKLNPKMKGPILCFVGPPGVGKTSLGRSIARTMGRKFTRISLGGLKDEAEIRGHRRTYIGALPGRIIQGLKMAGSNNPVFMMDEIDKVGTDFRGDPSSALLEVLDPEQNVSFSDHYLNVPFDLSRVMFITTANLIDPVPSALRDRMEVISISGYTDQEKLEIARKYLLPRQLKENGLTAKDLELSKATLLTVINEYTEEAGLRNLEREIGKICRKVARRLAEEEPGPFRITRTNLHRYLGVPKFLPEADLEADEVGVATGLAWTPAGGDILRIEATTMPGKGMLMLTGQLGEVMKESGQAALSYARSRAERFGLKLDFYEKLDLHIHVPAGAIPKDGPSAGVSMATALISTLCRRPIRRDLAMTGEITLRGYVLPVGGLREKALAALRQKIYTVLIPAENRKDLTEIPRNLRRQLHFVPVKHMDEILELALRPPSDKTA